MSNGTQHQTETCPAFCREHRVDPDYGITHLGTERIVTIDDGTRPKPRRGSRRHKSLRVTPVLTDEGVLEMWLTLPGGTPVAVDRQAWTTLCEATA